MGRNLIIKAPVLSMGALILDGGKARTLPSLLKSHIFREVNTSVIFNFPMTTFIWPYANDFSFGFKI